MRVSPPITTMGRSPRTHTARAIELMAWLSVSDLEALKDTLDDQLIEDWARRAFRAGYLALARNLRR